MAASTASAFRQPRKLTVTPGPASYASSSSYQHQDHSGPPSASSSSSANTAMPGSATPGAGPSTLASSSSSFASNAGTPSASSDGGIGSSLIGMGTGPGGVHLQNGAPVAANSIANRPAVASSGLYQFCYVLRERLWCVPDFGDRYLAESEEHEQQMRNAEEAGLVEGEDHKAEPNNPVTQLIEVFRLGTPLCDLYNLLQPASPLPTELGEGAAGSANACKKLVAKFIMALQNEMEVLPDDMFTVMQVYRESTNDWVKVFRVVSKVVDKLEERGILIESERSQNMYDSNAKPCDDRAWIVKELIDSERKYVQDLEVLQNCARALQQHDLLSADRLHDLFSNLNNLVDFQRRVLIHLEDNARKPVEEQRFGRAFQVLEKNIDVYWPFCANYATALEVVGDEAGNIQRLKGLPGAEGCYLDPAYELPAFLIKPVQRICKYPLLLEQLSKKSDPNGPYFEELKSGLAIVQRCATQVNEVRRVQENKQLVADLAARVEDWKEHSLPQFGRLLLCETLTVVKGNTDREYIVYLFDRILLCCKDLQPAPSAGKKNSKSGGLLNKQRTPSTGSAGAPKKPGKTLTPLQLKGRIFINNVVAAKPEFIPAAPGVPGSYSLSVQWLAGEGMQESFSLRCKNEEQLKMWQSNLQRLIDDAKMQAQQQAMGEGDSMGYVSGSATPVNLAGTGANGRRNTGGSQHGNGSSFPQTPISEIGHTMFPFTRADSQMSQYRSSNAEDNGVISTGAAMATAFGHHENGSGRVTPLSGLTRYSQPAEQRERQASLAPDSRPRAMTEDQGSSTMTQWRSNGSAVPPPLPRKTSSSSAGSGGDAHPGLRKASSSRQLRQQLPSGGSRLPYVTDGEVTSSPMQQAGYPEPVHPAVSRHRGESNAMAPTMVRAHSESGGSHHMVRNRSASTSQSAAPHQLFQQQQQQAGQYGAPPMPRSRNGSSTGPGADQLHINTGFGPRSHGIHPAHLQAPMSASPAPTASSNGTAHPYTSGPKRSSNSSNSTLDSLQSGPSRPGSTAASSPLTMSAGSSTGTGGGNAIPKPATTSVPAVPQRSGSYGATGRTGSPVVHSNHSSNSSNHAASVGNLVRVQVHSGGDVLSMAVPPTMAYAALVDKVASKLRAASLSSSDASNLKLKYIDEDGDRVGMHDDEDVQMALEVGKATGGDVVLYAA